MSPEILLALAALVVGAVVGAAFMRGRGGAPQGLAELRDAVVRAEGKISQFTESQEGRWRTFGEEARQQAKTANDTIGSLREKIGEVLEAHRRLEKLDSHVVDLQKLLANRQAAGAFGEIQLENLVRQALPPAAYDFQKTLSNGKRADCLVDLPHPPGPIAIDSKFPLASYRAVVAAESDGAAKTARRDMDRAVRGHVDDIAERYIIAGETCDWAVMFLPSETLFAEIHEHLPEVVKHAFERRVAIVSPSTLMALLNTIRGVLRDAEFRANADLIQRELGVLMKDVERLGQRVGKLRTHFDQAQEDVRQIVISSDKVATRAGNIREVEIGEAGEEPARIGDGD